MKTAISILANLSQLYTIDRSLLTERVKALPPEALTRIDAGLRVMLEL